MLTFSPAATYAKNTQATTSARGLEYRVFAQSTRQLVLALEDGGDISAIARGVYDNRRLWQVIAADVADADNGLPEQLRGRLFYLAEFVEQHSRKVLAGAATVAALVDVNKAVMRGLVNQEGAEA